MSFHFYRIDKLASEEELLRKKLEIENQIRKQREKMRRSKSLEGQRYQRIFKPVTKSIEELKAIQKPDPSVENLIDFDDHMVEPKVEEVDADEKPGELFRRALESIPSAKQDDGVFGLNVKTNEIGNNNFSIKGNILMVQNKDTNVVKPFPINELDLWRLLLAQRPISIGMYLSDEKGHHILKDYDEIVRELDLVQDAANKGVNFTARAKFKLLKNLKRGSGFLFSTRPPPFIKVFPPSTVVIPSDKKGLLRALLQAVAELRAGNTSMQNIVVPLAQEAKRKKILPHNLLSSDEMTWIFA